VFVFFQMMLFVWMFILDLAAICRLSDEAKDLELLLLRQQLRIVERRQKRGPHIPRWQKVVGVKKVNLFPKDDEIR
jgi:hypothetical protein